MSILINPGTFNSSDVDLSSQGRIATAEQPRSSLRMKPVRHEDEPLEEA